MPHVELDAQRGVIWFQTTWNHKDLVRQVPGARWDAEHKRWTAPLTWTSVTVARGVFGEQLTVGPELTDWAWREYHDRIQPALELRNAMEPIDDNSPEYQVLTSWNGGDAQPNLYSFQTAGVQFMLRAGSGLLGDEMGSGLDR